MDLKKRILVAPLNWGLGHATRCIPIIEALISEGFEPVIASDGRALNLLTEEFPQLEKIELPGYDITYAKKGKYLKLKLLKNSPKAIKAIAKEKKLVKKLVKEGKIDGIISDNRLGVRSKKVPSVFITHQLKVMSGKTTWLTTKMHSKVISKYKECWVPDTKEAPSLSGKLGHAEKIDVPVKYIGPITRFRKENRATVYSLMVLLSGPEPQRTMLEELLFEELKKFKGSVLFVKGRVELEQEITQKNHFTIYNYMNSEQLQKAINESEMVLSRSGYTTIMDLAKIGKKAFFIPTPGQFEQEYLAKRLTEHGLVPSCHQKDFKLEMLSQVSVFKGLKNFDYEVDYKDLFSLF